MGPCYCQRPTKKLHFGAKGLSGLLLSALEGNCMNDVGVSGTNPGLRRPWGAGQPGGDSLFRAQKWMDSMNTGLDHAHPLWFGDVSRKHLRFQISPPLRTLSSLHDLWYPGHQHLRQGWPSTEPCNVHPSKETSDPDLSPGAPQTPT